MYIYNSQQTKIIKLNKNKKKTMKTVSNYKTGQIRSRIDNIKLTLMCLRQKRI